MGHIQKLVVLILLFLAPAVPAMAQGFCGNRPCTILDGAATQTFNGKKYKAVDFEVLAPEVNRSCLFDETSPLRGARVATIASMRSVAWPKKKLGNFYLEDMTPLDEKGRLILPNIWTDITKIYEDLSATDWIKSCTGMNMRNCQMAFYGRIEYVTAERAGHKMFKPRCMFMVDGYHRLGVKDEGDGLLGKMVESFFKGFAIGSGL